MPLRSLIILATTLLLAASFTAYLTWRNSPAQVAKRYLEKLAQTATVYPEDSPLNRRLRAPRLAELLADPLAIHVPQARVSGSFDRDELLSGYLSVTLEARYFQVTFSNVRLLEPSSDRLKLQARLNVQSDLSEEPFHFDQDVDLEVSKTGNRLLLSRVRTVRN